MNGNDDLIELLAKYKNQNQQNEAIANEFKNEKRKINHDLNKVIKQKSEELKINDKNKVVDNLKETFSQTESKKNKINETILFSCRKKGIMTESFSLEINCDDIDNNLLFKDFIKELVAKGVFYCSSNKVSDHYKAIYCNGVPASELTVGEVLKLPAVSVQNKFIVGMPWLHINGVYVNKTVKLEDVVKSHVQVESQEQLNKKSLEQPKLESTLLKDNLDEGKKESDYNSQTMKLKDVIELRDGIRNQQQISNEKQDKQDNVNVDNSNSNINLLDSHSDKKNQAITIKARTKGQNFANFSIEFENGDIDDSYTVGQLIDLLYDAQVVICKREGGWKGASYSEHDARERQKSILEAFSSYTTPRITLFESVFYDSSYFNKKMTFKNLIKSRDGLKSEELKKQGHLSEKSTQSKIDKTKSETLVDKNNLSNLLQNDNDEHSKNSKGTLITEKRKEQLTDKNEIDQQTNENNPTGLFLKNDKNQKKDSVDKDINSVLKLKSDGYPNNKNIKRGCFAMKKNSEYGEGQGYIFEEGNSFYIKFDDLLIAIKKALKIKDTDANGVVKSIDIRYGAHMCESLFGQRGNNGIYFDSEDKRFKSLLGININNGKKNKLLCFKTFIGGRQLSGCEKNSCVGFYRVGFELNVNIGSESKIICFASFPDGDEDEDFSSVSLYRVDSFEDKLASETDNKILIYQNKDVTKGIVEVTGNMISECPNLEIIDGNGVELESKIGITNIDVDNNKKNMENQYQTFGDSDEICEKSLKIEIWYGQEVGDGFTLEIEPDDINNESNSSQLEPLINALGEYPVNPKGLIESLSQLLVSTSMFDDKISGISRYDSHAFEHWNGKNLKQKYKALVGRTHSISIYGAKLNDKKYRGATIKFKEVLQLQLYSKQLQMLPPQKKFGNEKTNDIKAKENVNNMPINKSNQDVKFNVDTAKSTTPLQKFNVQKKNEQEENNMLLLGDEKRLQEQYKDKDKEVQSTKQIENVKEHGRPNVVLIFIKSNRRKITISIFSIGAGIAIGAIAGWIFAPILPIVGLALILSDLKFNFLEPTEVSKDLNVSLKPKENKPLGHNQIATEKPGQENLDSSKSSTLLP